MPDIIQRSFTSGEIAPSLRSRVDLNKYQSGLALCENFLIRAQGGAYSRPGTRFIGEVGDSTKQARLLPFSFSTEQTYILVFEHLTMRVIKDGAYIETAPDTPYELVTPYTEAELSRLIITQDADVLTIVHPSHDPANLSRITELNWNLTAISYAPTVTAPTISSVASVGTGHGSNNRTYVYVVTAVDADGIESLASSSSSQTIGSLTTTGGLRITWGSIAAADYYRVYKDPSNGTDVFGWIGDSKNLTFDDFNFAPDTSDSHPVDRQPFALGDTVVINGATQADPCVITTAAAHGLTSDDGVWIASIVGMTELNDARYNITVLSPTTFSLQTSDTNEDVDSTGFTAYGSGGTVAEADNYPSTVAYYQQRQIFANTNDEPQAVYTTQTGNFNSLRVSSPIKDDDAVTFTIAARQVNEIRHILSLDSMILLTSGGEWKATEGQDQVLTPSTIGVKSQSFNGASWVPPVIINNTALYVQEKGARIRDLGYQFSADKFEGNDLSLMSEHLFEGYQITEMAFSAEPYGILWCVRNDGVLLGLTYQREHQVWGWHQHDLGGTVESVAVISEDNRDALYMVVNRSAGRYIERMEIRDVSDAVNAFCVDSGLSYDVPVAITGATQADPVVITAVAHGFSDDDGVRIGDEDIIGMTELNGNYYTVQNKTADTFELTSNGSDVDGTGFTAYVSGGEVRKTATVFTGADHLEGESIAVLADGNEVTGLTVSSGSFTIPNASGIVHFGKAYTPAMELLDIDAPGQTSVKGRPVSVSEVTVEVESSRGGFVGAKLDAGGTATMREIKPRFESDGYDAIALKTFKEVVNIEPEWQKGGGIRIEQRSPLPLTVLSVIPKVDIGG